MIIACPQCQLRYDATGRPPGSTLSCRCGQSLTVPSADQTARSLRCPNCGGPVPVDSNRCQFCETDLAVLNCPECFSLQFLGSKFCSDCGSEMIKPAKTENQNQLNCPRCETPLTTRRYARGAIDHCPSCSGIWFDHEIFEKTVEHNRKKADMSLKPSKPGQHNVYNNHPVSYLPCPECNSLMSRRNFAQRSGVIVDVCSAHGVWLDHKELSAILNFIREGGMKTPSNQNTPPLAAPTSATNKSPFGVQTTIKQEADQFGTLDFGDVVDLLKSLPIFR